MLRPFDSESHRIRWARICRSSRSGRVTSLSLLVVGMIVFMTSFASAEDVTLTGVDGERGLPGSGLEEAGDGEAGGDVLVVVGPTDPQNTGTATGGQGGDGGTGRLGADGGDGGTGGSAQTEATSTQPASEAAATAHATGGQGGDGGLSFGATTGEGGQGGIAEASAVATSSELFATVTASATAIGGRGGRDSQGEERGGSGGSASATARGVSTGGGDVSATAIVIGGNGRDGGASADAVVMNAVSGETTGRLHLVQQAIGGGDRLGLGGNAVSVLEFIDDDSGALEIESIARGGLGILAGNAVASASGTGVDTVRVTARATGGQGARAADGGRASLGTVYGESTSGADVFVEGEAIGGDGGSTYRAREGPLQAGAGGDAVVENAVDGRTSGSLHLIQRAIGGDAASFGTDGMGNSAGNATSTLRRTLTVGELEVAIEAIGGEGSRQQTETEGATDGGRARAELDLTNNGGPATAFVHASGGMGGDGAYGVVGGNGGLAEIRASLTTTDTGQDVTIGGSGTFGAVGGLGRVRFGTIAGEAGDGGDANSRSVGTALGDSRVSVHDRATGGTGFNGGNALSHAEGHNTGAESVSVLAEAIAGNASRPNGHGGVASASARGTSTSGDVSATTIASGGENGFTSAGESPLDGIAVTLVDSVSGSTSGVLTLLQRALGGPGAGSADPIGGSGGAAESLVDATNEGGGDLVLVSEAIGGEANGELSVGGSASVSAHGIGSGDASVDVTGLARGGNGNPPDFQSSQMGAGDGGSATLGSVSGESLGGGTVRVRGEVFGGRGGRFGGNGADAIIDDAVSGSTTGELTLGQLAVGGDGAVGGFASSRLSQESHSSRMVVESEARGGASREDVSQSPTAVGGDAESILQVENSGGALTAFSLARAGEGFDSDSRNGALSSSGGSADVRAYARTMGDGHEIILGDSASSSFATRSGAYGGEGGSNVRDALLAGRGGNATSESVAIASGDSAVTVFDRAVGGDGGITGLAMEGDGGNAASVATGRNTGGSRVIVTADAVGGDAGWNQLRDPSASASAVAGLALAQASGFSDRGDVDVTAIQRSGYGATVAFGSGGRGADSSSINSVSGGTSGLLTLSQTAIGGNGGGGLVAGDGGNATSTLDTENQGDGALSASVEAIAGDGGRTLMRDGSSGSGGDAYVGASTVPSASAPVYLAARAVGGMGGSAFASTRELRNGGAGGAANVGPLSATSADGGRVELVAEAIGGSGGAGSNAGGTGGNGRSVRLENAVQGSTSGELLLTQRAVGGDAGGGTIAGRAGGAHSQVIAATSSASLEIQSEALGGDGFGIGGSFGGAATSIVDANNQGGTSKIVARADGGGIGPAPTRTSPPLEGGEASVAVNSRSVLNNQDIHIGEAYTENLSNSVMGAFGGVGGSGSVSLGGGGDATSVSEGVALGKSDVEVWDLAVGGRSIGPFRTLQPTDGGDASSSATARAGGGMRADANAMAVGGRTEFNSASRPMRAGSAIAVARSHGGGESNAIAHARTGDFSSSSRLSTAGASIASSTAEASGASGVARAVAEGRGGEIGSFPTYQTFALASASVASTVGVEARAGASARDALSSTEDAAAFVTGAHGRAGEWGRVGLHVGSNQQAQMKEKLDIVLHAEAGFQNQRTSRDSLDGIFVSFLETEYNTKSLRGLVFRIENAGDVLLERSFNGSRDARDFFDSVLDLGDFDDHVLTTVIDLRFVIDSANAPRGSKFGTYFAVGIVAVPEPGTGILLVAGLIVLSSRRRKARVRT